MVKKGSEGGGDGGQKSRRAFRKRTDGDVMNGQKEGGGTRRIRRERERDGSQ